jgi:hypothetical protein
MDWDPTLGEESPIFLKNHPLALAESGFVTSAISPHVHPPPLGCIQQRGQEMLIWNGRHVNKKLVKAQVQGGDPPTGGQLFVRVQPSRLHRGYFQRVPKRRDGRFCTPFPRFRVARRFLLLRSAPFRPLMAQWLFTTIMSHSIRFIRYTGGDVIAFLDDCIFGGSTAHGTVTSAQRVLGVLREFGWLIHPTKCVGTTSALQTFVALGTLVDLVAHTYAVPPATLTRILAGLTTLVTGPPRVVVRDVARVKGLLASTWVATGVATCICTREMDRVIASRPPPAGESLRERRAAWAALVTLTPDCLAELVWWLDNIHSINGCLILSTPFADRFDSVTECGFSYTGYGSVTFVDGPLAPSSTLVAELLALATGHLTRRSVIRRARRGIEFAASFPKNMLETSSTLRELFGIYRVLCAIAPLLSGGRHKVVMDNLQQGLANGASSCRTGPLTPTSKDWWSLSSTSSTSTGFC